MQRILFNSRLLRYVRRLIYGKHPGNMSPTEKRKVLVENDLRWEDDGGPVIETADPIPQPTDMAGKSLLKDDE